MLIICFDIVMDLYNFVFQSLSALLVDLFLRIDYRVYRYFFFLLMRWRISMVRIFCIDLSQ